MNILATKHTITQFATQFHNVSWNQKWIEIQCYISTERETSYVNSNNIQLCSSRMILFWTVVYYSTLYIAINTMLLIYFSQAPIQLICLFLFPNIFINAFRGEHTFLYIYICEKQQHTARLYREISMHAHAGCIENKYSTFKYSSFEQWHVEYFGIDKNTFDASRKIRWHIDVINKTLGIFSLWRDTLIHIHHHRLYMDVCVICKQIHCKRIVFKRYFVSFRCNYVHNTRYFPVRSLTISLNAMWCDIYPLYTGLNVDYNSFLK